MKQIINVDKNIKMSKLNELKQCPNCGKKKTIWNEFSFLSQEKIDFINLFNPAKQEAYCNGTDCGFTLLHQYQDKCTEEKNKLMADLQVVIETIPVITLQNPMGWEYDILDMVTAQTTTGTGAITEIFAQVADFMGEQSHRHNNKIKNAENLCKLQLRDIVSELGGNAVIACDVDISTTGLGNGLIIVCMSGTAIRIRNVEILGGNAEKINQIPKIKSEINHLNNCLRNALKI